MIARFARRSVHWTISVAACCAALTVAVWRTAPALTASETIPSQAHLALWVDDISKAREEMRQNNFFQLLTDEKSGVGEGPGAIRETIRRLPVSSADPLYSFWSVFLPVLDHTLRDSMESANSVFKLQASDLADTFSGSLAIYSTLYDLYVQNKIDIVEWDVILAAEYKPEEKPKVDDFLKRALARVPSDARKKKVDYFGHDVYHITYYLDEQANLPGDKKDLDLDLVQEIPVIVEYGYVDGYFLMAEGRGEPLKHVVRAMSESGKPTRLVEQDKFRRAMQLIEDVPGQIHFYVDIAHHTQEMADVPSQRASNLLMKALGLEQCGPLVANVEIDAKGARLAAGMRPPATPVGIFRLMVQSPTDDLARVRLVPNDAELAGSLSLDFAELQRQYRQSAQITGNSSSFLLDTAVSQMKNITGVDLEKDILAHMSGEMITYIRPPSDNTRGSDAVILLPLSGGIEVTDSVNKLLRALSGEKTRLLDLEETDYQGHTLWESPAGTATGATGGIFLSAAPTGLAYASSGAQLREVLRRLGGQVDDSIVQDQTFVDVRDAIPDEALRAFVYLPPKSVAENFRLKGLLAGAPGDSVERDEMLKRFGASWWTLNAPYGGIVLRYVIAMPESGKAP